MEYELLGELIEPYADRPLSKLPKTLRVRVETEFSECGHTWTSLTPSWRRSLAQQLDDQHDPAMRLQIEYYLALFDEVEKTKNAITTLELMNDRTPTDARIKREDLTALGNRLDKLKKLQTMQLF